MALVTPQYYDLHDSAGVTLESKRKLEPVSVCYETYGQLNADGSNALLLTHALSGDAHAAGRHQEDDAKPGWWDLMIGPGKPIDTNQYFVVCSNVLGGCKGTTGPSSEDPQTGKPYALDFPVVTIADMVAVQKRLMEHLQIPFWHSVIGGSMGGMQALQWAVSFPDLVKSIIVLASTARLSAQSIAFNEVGRNAIMSDPQWRQGQYYGHSSPDQGLAVARMVGHITYLSTEAMHEKFGRSLMEKQDLSFDFSTDFAVESYLRYQGSRFVERFDANSYLYMTKAMDYFDLTKQYGSLEEAFERVLAKVLVVSFSTDWLFPSAQSLDIVQAMRKVGKNVSFCEIESSCGHDAFLLPSEPLNDLLEGFIAHVDRG